MIGAERGRRKGSGPSRSPAGLRTFTVTSLAGAISVLVGGEMLLAVSTAALSAEQAREPGAMLREGTWIDEAGAYSVPQALAQTKPANWPVDGWYRLTLRSDPNLTERAPSPPGGLPVFMLSGVAGKLFTPLGTAYVLSTLPSLGVALLVTPPPCAVLLRNAAPPPDRRLVTFLNARYAGVLPHPLPPPRTPPAPAVVLSLSSA